MDLILYGVMQHYCQLSKTEVATDTKEMNAIKSKDTIYHAQKYYKLLSIHMVCYKTLLKRNYNAQLAHTSVKTTRNKEE